jgi:lysophospholipase L1-like esterase
MGFARVALAVVLALAVTACSGTAARSAVPASYYLALGDSLSQGVQPNAAGTSIETPHGYANQVYAAVLPDHPGLRLVKLGCPGETTSTMIHGGICRYRDGSQLAAAVAFLRAHRGHIFLVTIDIGANDPEDCGAKSGLSQIAACYLTDVPGAVSNLGTIMSSLRAAAGQNVRIVGMSYYLPVLAEWRDGFGGEEIARFIARLATSYNNLLGQVYGRYDAPVANVFGAFDTSNFGDPVSVPGIGTLPRNVALICQWTWECAAPPRGPNQHANQAGYAVIAREFLGAAGLS